MAALYADEHFPAQVTRYLRKLDHDVLTVQQTNKSKFGDGAHDGEILAFATLAGRAVLTENRKDFYKLQQEFPRHRGIVCSRVYLDWKKQAKEFDEAIRHEERMHGSLDGLLIRIPYQFDDPSRPVPLKQGE